MQRGHLTRGSWYNEAQTCFDRKSCALIRPDAQEAPSPGRDPEEVLRCRPVPCASNDSGTPAPQECCISRADVTPVRCSTENPRIYALTTALVLHARRREPVPSYSVTRFVSCLRAPNSQLHEGTRRDGAWPITPGELDDTLILSLLVHASISIRTSVAIPSGRPRASERGPHSGPEPDCPRCA